MGRLIMSDLDKDGERVVRLFAEELKTRGREGDDWTIWQDGSGVSVRHSAALNGDEPLLIGSDELRVLKIVDYQITDAIRTYLNFVLAEDRE